MTSIPGNAEDAAPENVRRGDSSVCDSVSLIGACTPMSGFGSYSPLGGGFGEDGD